MIVTVLAGSDARGAETERVRAQVALAHPQVEVEVRWLPSGSSNDPSTGELLGRALYDPARPGEAVRVR